MEITAILLWNRRTAENREGGIREDGDKSNIDARGVVLALMMKDFRKAIAEEVLLADGAIGTLLDLPGRLARSGASRR